MERLIGMKELAERLGVSRATVQRLTAAGEIGCARVGRQIRYTEQHITDYLEGRPPANAAADPLHAGDAGTYPGTDSLFAASERAANAAAERAAREARHAAPDDVTA